MVISKLLRKPETEILTQALRDDELNETLDVSPTTPQLVNGK